MRHIALEISYDGTSYAGWQIQKNAVTVQSVIQDTLGEILKKKQRLKFAGRTDAGVHAIGQIASFESESRMTKKEFHCALNSKLPDDIRIIRVFEVPMSFHPRYSAKKRWYRYIVNDAPVLFPFFNNYTLWTNRKLDVILQNKYCRKITGSHDFTSFATVEIDEVPYREVYQCQCYRKNDFVIFDIIANSFLRKMVRTIIGTFLRLERLAEKPERVSEILQARDRELAGQTANPGGLYLVKVFY